MGLKPQISCLFLDRDGVINQHPESHYVFTWENFKFCPGALEAIRLMRPYCDRIVVITNQQGVGKGLMSMEDLNHIHLRMAQAIKGFGGEIDAIMACTQLASTSDNCRKPNPKMGTNAKEKFPEIDFHKSIMIGDQRSDYEFANALSMQFVQIENPHKSVHIPDIPKYSTLLEWAQLFLAQHDQ